MVFLFQIADYIKCLGTVVCFGICMALLIGWLQR